MNSQKQLELRSLIPLLLLGMLVEGCGRKQAFDMGDELGPAILGGDGATRTQSVARTTTQTFSRPKTSRTLFNIVPVTQIIPATSGIPGWLNSDLPFTGAPVVIGQAVTDGQTPFQFDFDFPQNNYQFIEAHLVIDTARDNSDTEGIFLDGIFSGKPPTNMVNNASSKITDKIFIGSGAATENGYYISWALSHYKIATRNSFDLLLSDLTTGTSKSAIDILSDGVVPVVTGDDSPVYQAYLVIKGRTISSADLSCVNSNTYTFTNQYLHNDGNTVGQSAFSGSIAKPIESWTPAIGTYAATEFNYDSALPKVDVANITISNARLLMKLKRGASGQSAIVINGIGVAGTGFNKSAATAVVESWNDSGTATWDALVSTVPAGGAATDVSLDLNAMLGADVVRDLLAQGKLNVSVAGNVVVYASALTSTRTFGVAVNGPELKLDGTYYTQVCEVPNDPSSPLTQNGIVVSDDEGGEETTTETILEDDGEGPTLTSVSASEITANAATILWLTDEASTTQVRYGIGGLTQSTAEDSSLSTYHEVRLTGLSPYKYYNFQVVSKDRYGNESTSEVTVFVTLR